MLFELSRYRTLAYRSEKGRPSQSVSARGKTCEFQWEYEVECSGPSSTSFLRGIRTVLSNTVLLSSLGFLRGFSTSAIDDVSELGVDEVDELSPECDVSQVPWGPLYITLRFSFVSSACSSLRRFPIAALQ